MNLRSPRRVLHVVVVVACLVLGSVALSACGGSGASTLGHQACVEVSKSISIYESAAKQTPAKATADREKALNDLRAALQPASIAGSEDGSWQALMATLGESSRVSENLLIPALNAQCQSTLSGNS